MQLRKEYLISYDIENNKTRTRLHKELLAYGLQAVQKSVFWGYLSNAELAAIQRQLKKALDTYDKALITRTNFNGKGQSHLIGHIKEDFKDWATTKII